MNKRIFKRSNKQRYRARKYMINRIISRIRIKQIRPTHVYPIDVNTVAIIQSTTQPQQNFSYSISNNIYENQYYQNYAKIYQEFKIVYTQIHIVPVIRDADQPPMMYAIVLANEQLTVQYNQIPSLPGVTKIYGRGVTQMIFKTEGRTDDLNRWYNTKDLKPDFSLKIHSIASIGTTDDTPHYTINVRSRVCFRRPIIEESNNKEIEQYENIMGLNTKKNQDVVACVEEIKGMDP